MGEEIMGRECIVPVISIIIIIVYNVNVNG